LEPKEAEADPGDLLAHLVGLGGWESSGPMWDGEPWGKHTKRFGKNPLVSENDLLK
jgi:hypothetical protein